MTVTQRNIRVSSLTGARWVARNYALLTLEVETGWGREVVVDGIRQEVRITSRYNY